MQTRGEPTDTDRHTTNVACVRRSRRARCLGAVRSDRAASGDDLPLVGGDLIDESFVRAANLLDLLLGRDDVLPPLLEVEQQILRGDLREEGRRARLGWAGVDWQKGGRPVETALATSDEIFLGKPYC